LKELIVPALVVAVLLFAAYITFDEWRKERRKGESR